MVQIGIYWVGYHLFLWLAMFLFRYAESRLTSTFSDNPVSLQEMYGQFVRDYYPIAICATVMLPIVLLDLMKLTHRIAGPLVRFQNVLRDLTDGKTVPTIKLRKGDLLTDLLGELNRYLARLAERRQSDSGTSDAEAAVASEVDELCRTVHEATQQSATASSVAT